MKADHLQGEKRIKVSGRLYEHNGIYQMGFNWMEPGGKRGRKSKSTGLPVKGNKKRAELLVSAVRKELEEQVNQRIARGGILFADFMENWLEIIKPEVKQTTYGGYCYNVKSIIAPWFRAKQISLQDLTADDIEEFYENQMLRVKGTSVYKFHANISKALKYAVRKHLIPYSVMSEVIPPKKDRFVGKFLTQSEAVRLFDAIKGHKLELGVILGTYYGLRRGEILGLRWEAIDFEANTISIGHTVTPAQVDGHRVLIEDDTTKTDASMRTLPLVPVFRTKLLELMEQQQNNRKLCGKSYNKAHQAYIYTDSMGNRIMPDYLSKAFPKFMETHGFRRMRFHDTRHSCASLLLASNVPLKQIQEWLGHKSFSITADTYAHLEYQTKKISANAMTWIHNTELGRLANNEPQAIAQLTANGEKSIVIVN